MTSSTCIVTGGAGFIGCALSTPLADRFDEVIALDILHPQIHAARERPAALDPRVELVVGDVCDAAGWDALLARHRPDVIVHLAAETGTGQSLTEATRHAHVNVVGTTTMLDALTRARIAPKRFVLSSSRAVYGEGAWRAPSGDVFYPGQRSIAQLEAGRWDFDGAPLPMQADTLRPAPVSVYGATKLAQEQVLGVWCAATGAERVVLRFQNVYGPGQSLINSYTGIVSLFCQLARKGQSIPLYEDGEMLRDFVLIDDVAASVICAIEASAALDGRVFDIGQGVGATIGEMAREIAAIYGAPAPHVCGKFRFGDVRHAYCDTARARDDLGWTPAVTLPQGLRRLSSWIETQLRQAPT